MSTLANWVKSFSIYGTNCHLDANSSPIANGILVIFLKVSYALGVSSLIGSSKKSNVPLGSLLQKDAASATENLWCRSTPNTTSLPNSLLALIIHSAVLFRDSLGSKINSFSVIPLDFVFIDSNSPEPPSLDMLSLKACQPDLIKSFAWSIISWLGGADVVAKVGTKSLCFPPINS